MERHHHNGRHFPGDSYHPKLIAGMDAADAALAQEQEGSDDNQV